MLEALHQNMGKSVSSAFNWRVSDWESPTRGAPAMPVSPQLSFDFWPFLCWSGKLLRWRWAPGPGHCSARCLRSRPTVKSAVPLVPLLPLVPLVSPRSQTTPLWGAAASFQGTLDSRRSRQSLVPSLRLGTRENKLLLNFSIPVFLPSWRSWPLGGSFLNPISTHQQSHLIFSYLSS